VSDATIISVETAKREPLEVAGFVEDASRVYGKGRITLLRRG
jgi:16S rRNA (guanine966-N2)-methyltransferase